MQCLTPLSPQLRRRFSKDARVVKGTETIMPVDERGREIDAVPSQPPCSSIRRAGRSIMQALNSTQMQDGCSQIGSSSRYWGSLLAPTLTARRRKRVRVFPNWTLGDCGRACVRVSREKERQFARATRESSRCELILSEAHHGRIAPGTIRNPCEI